MQVIKQAFEVRFNHFLTLEIKYNIFLYNNIILYT